VLSDPRVVVTLHELDTHWSLADLADAHAALDLRDELERKARPPPPTR
jgi:hypothetical protein